MTKENFWSDAARCGAVLGLILSGSFLLETAFSLSGNGTLRNLVAVESVAVAVLHYYLLHRYTRQRSRLFSREEGFQFMHAYAFIQVISIFAGLLVGCTNFILTHLVIGYDRFLELSSQSLAEIASQAGNQMLQGSINEMIMALQQADEPTLFDTIFSNVFTGWLFGAVFGLIISGVLARRPQLFGEQNKEEDDE